MTGYTKITLYTEGYTTTPEEVSLVAGSELTPAEVASLIGDMSDSFEEYGGIIVMTHFFSRNDLALNSLNFFTGEPYEEYFVGFIPEEESELLEDKPFSRRKDNGDWEDYKLGQF